MRPLQAIWFSVAVLVFALSVTTTVSAQGVPVGEATDEQKSQAGGAYAEGRKAFDARRFVDALSSFRASYQVVASPNTHLMMAHTLRELGRHAEAFDEFGSVAEEAREAAKTDEKYKASVDLALEEQELLRSKVGLVTVQVVGADEGATLSVDGRSIDRARWGSPVAIDPGTVKFLLTTSSDPIVQDVEVTAGQASTITLDATVEPVAETPTEKTPIAWLSTLRIVSYAVAGAGVLSFGAAAGLGAAAQGKHDELQEACGDAPCPERQDDIDGGRTFQTASNVMLVVGGGLLVGGVVLWFLAPTIDGSAEGEVTVGLTTNGSTIGLKGTF